MFVALGVEVEIGSAVRLGGRLRRRGGAGRRGGAERCGVLERRDSGAGERPLVFVLSRVGRLRGLCGRGNGGCLRRRGWRLQRGGRDRRSVGGRRWRSRGGGSGRRGGRRRTRGGRRRCRSRRRCARGCGRRGRRFRGLAPTDTEADGNRHRRRHRDSRRQAPSATAGGGHLGGVRVVVAGDALADPSPERCRRGRLRRNRSREAVRSGSDSGRAGAGGAGVGGAAIVGSRGITVALFDPARAPVSAANAASSRSLSACTVVGRRSGSFSRQSRMIRSIAAGAIGRWLDGGAGFSVTCLRTISCAVTPSNGSAPAKIW